MLVACQKQQNNDLRSIRENIYFGVVLDKVGGSVTNGSSRALLRGRFFINLGKVLMLLQQGQFGNKSLCLSLKPQNGLDKKIGLERHCMKLLH